jgi:RNA polymerase sigma-70 factor (sigma-E family)
MTPEGNDTRTPQDEVLARLYRQGTGWQAARYAATYDASAGLTRFNAWLQEHTAVDVVLAAIEADAGAIPVPSRPATRTEILAVTGAIPPDPFAPSATADMGWSADRAVIELFSVHYRPLVYLAVMLVRDTATAEEVVQDAFVAMHDGWDRLRDADKALAYLRQAVVNRCRSVLRHRAVVDPNLQQAPGLPSAEHDAPVLPEQNSVGPALRGLPERQREAIVLRYYADLSEEEIAAAMGISRGAVKSHTARGMATLRAALEQATSQPADPPDSGDAGRGHEPYLP